MFRDNKGFIMMSPYSPEQQKRINEAKVETVEEFLARGGTIQKSAKKVKNKNNKIDAQALLYAAIGTAHEQEVINFLASQGIDVE